MATWSGVAAEVPELAAAARGYFDALVTRRWRPFAPRRLAADQRQREPPHHLVIESWHEGRGLARLERR